MGYLLQIVFHQNVDTLISYSEHGFWWNFFKDFILPILLAGFAGWMAYFIFISETKRDKLAEEQKKNQERSDKLLFFMVLIESAIKISKHQNENIENQIKNITANDIDFHQMTLVPLNDLKRITEELNPEVYLLAYTNYFQSNRLNAVKEFKNIMASVDFIYELFQDIIKMLEKSQTYDYERKLKFQEIFHSSYKVLGELLLQTKENNIPFHNALNLVYANFTANHPGDNYDLNFYYNFFFLPFNDCVSNLIPNLQNPSKEILEFATLTRDGKQLFLQIKSQNKLLLEDLTADLKKTSKSLIELTGYSKRLLAIDFK